MFTNLKIRRIICVIIACCLLFIGYTQVKRIYTDNFDVIIPNEFYRSAQMKEERLQKVLQTHHIQTVINLCGSNPGSSLYEKEKDVCFQLNVKHIDVRWSAEKLPPPEEVLSLLETFRTQPYPMLIHCKAGADRTGLATALYLIDMKKFDEDKASKIGLNLNHGHLSIYPFFEMNEFVDLYKQSHNKDLYSWVKNEYPSIYQQEIKESKWHEVFECIR